MIDFGLSKAYLEGEHMRKVAGTSYYMAPEVLRGDYSEAADMWSFGVVVFMMLSGTCPFGGSDDDTIQRNVLRGKYAFKKKPWDGVNPLAMFERYPPRPLAQRCDRSSESELRSSKCRLE